MAYYKLNNCASEGAIKMAYYKALVATVGAIIMAITAEQRAY